MQAARRHELQDAATLGTAAGQTRGEQRSRAAVRRFAPCCKAQLGDDIYTSWFNSARIRELRRQDRQGLGAGEVPAQLDPIALPRPSAALLAAPSSRRAERVEVVCASRAQRSAACDGTRRRSTGVPAASATGAAAAHELPQRTAVLRLPAAGAAHVGGWLEGSPLDPRHTFDSFVVGASNRMAHAGATQVAETVLTDAPGFNPLYHPFLRRPRQDASSARHRLGGEAARAERAGALSDGRALPLSVRRGAAQARTRSPSRRSSASSTCC